MNKVRISICQQTFYHFLIPVSTRIIAFLGTSCRVQNKQLSCAIAVKAGGPEPENNPTLRSVIATCKRENMPKDNIERALKNAMGKDQSDYKSMTYEGYGPHGIAAVSYTHLDVYKRQGIDCSLVIELFFYFSDNGVLREDTRFEVID